MLSSKGPSLMAIRRAQRAKRSGRQYLNAPQNPTFLFGALAGALEGGNSVRGLFFEEP
jgi:hypothetical protein